MTGLLLLKELISLAELSHSHLLSKILLVLLQRGESYGGAQSTWRIDMIRLACIQPFLIPDLIALPAGRWRPWRTPVVRPIWSPSWPSGSWAAWRTSTRSCSYRICSEFCWRDSLMASFSNNNVAVSMRPLSRTWQRRRHCRVSLSGFKREKKLCLCLNK